MSDCDKNCPTKCCDVHLHLSAHILLGFKRARSTWPHGFHRVGCVTRRSPSCFELCFGQAQTGAESPTRTLNIATSMKSRRRLLTMQNGRAAATMFNVFTELSQLFVSKTSQVSIRASTIPDLGSFGLMKTGQHLTVYSSMTGTKATADPGHNMVEDRMSF